MSLRRVTARVRGLEPALAGMLVMALGAFAWGLPDADGVGHDAAISLKDEYRVQIIPLAAAAGAEYTPLYILRELHFNPDDGEDSTFCDDVQVFHNYQWSDGYNEQWWSRFAAYLAQCEAYRITVIPTLYDFCCSGAGPFGGYSVFDSADEDYVTSVVQYLDDSGVAYIINLGCEHNTLGYNPTASFLNDFIACLIGLGVSLAEEICIYDELLDDYDNGELDVIPGYVTDHGGYLPGGTAGHGQWSGDAAHTMNDEERMGGGGYPVPCGAVGYGSGWGGSGTTQQYINYLSACTGGIAAMNFWHLKAYNNCTNAVGGEDMEAIFAPHQRAAMIAVMSPALPAQASNPSPANGAAQVSLTADLGWTAGSGAIRHVVYFGTAGPGAFQGGQTNATFDPGPLQPNTTYYWRIDEVGDEGARMGEAWSFTTASGDVPGDFDGDQDVDQADFGYFQMCFSGAGNPCTPDCQEARLDADEDVDADDFSIFQACMSGPNVPGDPGCAD